MIQVKVVEDKLDSADGDEELADMWQGQWEGGAGLMLGDLAWESSQGHFSLPTSKSSYSSPTSHVRKLRLTSERQVASSHAKYTWQSCNLSIDRCF